MTNSPPSSDTETDAAYSGYERWKGWDEFMKLSASDEAYFAAECRDIEIASAKVLEIGFGSGKFLAFAQQRCDFIAGTEMNAVLVERANQNDIAIVGPDFKTLTLHYPGEFDTITAFDVFEHLDPEVLSEGLDCLVACLKPGGKALLRFPNGQSPFGLAPQHGDPTHRLALSRSYLEAVMGERPLTIERYGNAARVAIGSPITKLGQKFRFMLRNLIEKSLQRIYGNTLPHDPVVTMVLRRD